VSHDFEVGTNVSCEQSTVSPRTGLIFSTAVRHGPSVKAELVVAVCSVAAAADGVNEC